MFKQKILATAAIVLFANSLALAQVEGSGGSSVANRPDLVISDQFGVPTEDGSSNYYVKYQAKLRENGQRYNFEIAVYNPGLSRLSGGRPSFVSKLFKGPGTLSASTVENDLILKFTNSDGTVEQTEVKASTIQKSDCIDVDQKFRICINQRSSTVSGFGTNISSLIVQDLNQTFNDCSINGVTRYKSARSLHPAKLNKTFGLYYFPNQFEVANIDPIESVKHIIKNGKSLIEVKGQYGVYKNDVNPSRTVEYLDVEKFRELEYIGGCAKPSGPLGG